ncbi:hypothetical protein BJ742DRAFT_790726 [Cladochytrium replicatum]|nr:hypothetical protein BJ742DRAFT_790726 [Cladochytrium replicatum]
MASQMQTIQRPVSQLSAYYHSEPGGFPIYPLQALEYPSHSFLSRSRNETASEFGTRNPPQFLRDRSTRTQIVASKQPPFSRSLHRAGGETISNGQPRRVDTKVYFKKVATHATETDKSEGKQRTSDKGTISEATAQSSVNKMRSENSTSSYLVSDDQRNPRTDCEQQQPSEQVVPTPPRLKPTSAETVSRIPRFGRRKPEGQSLLSTSVQIPPRYVATAPSQRSVSPRMRRETIASLQHDQIVISTKKTNRQRQRMIAEQASSKGSRDRQLPRYPKLDTQSPTVARIYPSQSRHGAPPTFIKSPYPPIELNGAQSQHLPLASLNEVQQMKDMLLRDLHQLDHAIHQISR